MREVQPFATPDDWADACAARLVDALARAIGDGGRATFAGSGGSTPAPVYARMAAAGVDWPRVTTTLIDERYVPAEHPESNAALLKRTLLVGRAADAAFVPLFHPAVTVDRAAAMATRELAAATDRLDAVLLGMGEDGHICSMFPDSPTLKTLLTPTLKPTVLGVPHGRDGAAPTIERLSINLPYLMSAGRVILGLKGAAKRRVFEEQAKGDPKIQPIAALIAANVPLEVLWTEEG
jgi:6-phosphogluconolactonase